VPIPGPRIVLVSLGTPTLDQLAAAPARYADKVINPEDGPIWRWERNPVRRPTVSL
jgi:hypothetical protein